MATSGMAIRATGRGFCMALGRRRDELVSGQPFIGRLPLLESCLSEKVADP